MLQLLIGFGCFAAGIVVTLLVIAAGLFDPHVPSTPGGEWGKFPSRPKVELLDDGRLLRLLEDFVYIDPRGKPWVAQKDSEVNGASIPKPFWSIIGGPLEGKFRNASILHDEACKKMTSPRKDVHLMFYEACRCGGLSANKAKVMYAAVYHFGPHWVIESVAETRKHTGPDGRLRSFAVKMGVPRRVMSIREPSDETREKLEKYVSQHNPSLEDLQKIDPKSL